MVNGHNNATLAPPLGAANDDANAPAGDAGCLDAFVRQQSDALVGFLRLRSRSEEDARDAAQESLARLVRHYRQKPPAEWKPVLYRIAINVANDRLEQARNRSADLHVPIEGLEIEDERQNAEEAAARAQEAALLAEAVLALPKRCRQVYLLSRVHDKTNAEVACHCGISERMVEKHLANALVHIFRRFGRSPSGPL